MCSGSVGFPGTSGPGGGWAELGLAVWGCRTQGWCSWGQGGCSIVRQVDVWFYLWSQGDLFSFACLWSFLLSVEISMFLPVAFLLGAQTSLLAAPGSLHSQDPPGGAAASGPVPATSAKCPAPVPAARLRGCSLLGVAAPVLLCLSVQMFHPCQCSLCFHSYPLSLAPLLPGHISPLCQACCCVPVPTSLVLCIMYLFWTILFVHTNLERLQTIKRRYGN